MPRLSVGLIPAGRDSTHRTGPFSYTLLAVPARVDLGASPAKGRLDPTHPVGRAARADLRLHVGPEVTEARKALSAATRDELLSAR
jgi:hypothetical protein